MAKKYSKDEKIALINEWNNKSNGEKMPEFAKRKGIGESSIYAWKYQLGSQPIADARQIKQVPNGTDVKMVRIENQRLRQIVADQALDIQALKEYCGRR